jgi:hypothetical protein
MSHKPRPFLLAAAASAALLAGCGGSGDGPSLTRAQLIARATPICQQTINRATEAGKTLAAATSPAAELRTLATSAPALAAVQSRAVAQLRKLNPPASLARDWRSLLAGLQQLAEGTARIGADARTEGIRAVEAVAAAGRAPRTRILAIGARDGLGICARAN